MILKKVSLFLLATSLFANNSIGQENKSIKDLFLLVNKTPSCGCCNGYVLFLEEEKFKVQGINDLIVFSTMALGSLSAGIFLNLTSWETMNFICVPLLILIIITTFRADLKDKK